MGITKNAFGKSCATALLTLALSSALAEPAQASDHPPAAHGEAVGQGASAAAIDPTLPRTFDLGEFYVRNFRPTHNEIANIKFSLHLVLRPGTSHAAIAQLEHWKRRLRDQAITAVRSAEPADLAEPKLERVQRIMLLRIKRLPLPQPVLGVYLTDFAVGSG